MKVIVTCGPSIEPIDEVRRITNFSTGELGSRLSELLAEKGHDVICFRGLAATCSRGIDGAVLQSFTTNEDLVKKLERLSLESAPAVIFHTAALSDFKVVRILDSRGTQLQSRKIPSRQDRVVIELEPALKVIHLLKKWFPRTLVIGWKYELEGTIEDVLARAQRQIEECQSEACVVNGKAYGNGFGFYRKGETLRHFASKEELCHYLVALL